MTSENRSSSPIDSKILVTLWAAVFAAKLLLALVLPPLADETYYWVWSQRLSLSYFDHPGGIAWLLALNPFGPEFFRWPVVIVVHLSWLVWLFFLNRRLGAKATYWFLLALCAHPLTGLGSLIATPDAPLFVFWSFSFLLLWSWSENPERWKPPLAGFLLGLAFCSKYHAVLWVLSLAALFFLKEFRQRWTLGLFAATFACGLLGSAPVLVWNAAHDWVSFRFQLDHGLGRNAWHPRWTWETAIAILFIVGFWRARRDFVIWHRAAWLLTTVPALFFLVTSFRAPIEINWLGVCVPTALLLLALSRSLMSRVALGFWALAGTTLVVWSLLPTAFVPVVGTRLVEARENRRDLAAFEGLEPLYALNYQTASLYWFLLQRPVWKLSGASRFDQFDLWTESTPPRRFFLLLDRDQESRDVIPAGYEVKTVKVISDKNRLWTPTVWELEAR